MIITTEKVIAEVRARLLERDDLAEENELLQETVDRVSMLCETLVASTKADSAEQRIVKAIQKQLNWRNEK